MQRVLFFSLCVTHPPPLLATLQAKGKVTASSAAANLNGRSPHALPRPKGRFCHSFQTQQRHSGDGLAVRCSLADLAASSKRTVNHTAHHDYPYASISHPEHSMVPQGNCTVITTACSSSCRQGPSQDCFSVGTGLFAITSLRELSMTLHLDHRGALTLVAQQRDCMG